MTSTVYIAKNVYGGDGLGRFGDGRVVFVPGAWAGEQVRAEIVEEKKHYVKARLVEVVEKSPDRLESAGDTRLPGMVYADLSYKGECEAKELTGIESGRQAIDFAKRNASAQLATRNPKPETRFYAERVGQNLRRISVNSRTTVVVDPPRDGRRVLQGRGQDQELGRMGRPQGAGRVAGDRSSVRGWFSLRPRRRTAGCAEDLQMIQCCILQGCIMQ